VIIESKAKYKELVHNSKYDELVHSGDGIARDY
jgi:hypothetical protein